MTGTTQYDFNSSLLQALTGVKATLMDNSKRIEFMAKEISNKCIHPPCFIKQY